MHEPTRLSSFIMLLAKLSRTFLVGVFNTSDDCSQSQPSKPFKTMINIKRWIGAFFQENHAQFDFKPIKLKLSLWTGLIGQDKNAIAW